MVPKRGNDMKYHKRMAIVVVFALLMGGFLHAKVRAVNTRRDFEQTVAKGPMVVVLFYEDEKGNREIRGQNKGLIRMYEDLSTYKLYDDADIIFLKVNVGRKELADLAELYDVATMPIFIFFNNGKRMVDKQGSVADLKGFISRADLQLFIDEHYGNQITQYVARKKTRRQQAIAEENESWKPYFYPRDMVVRGYAPEERQENME